jgi:hypothetical protein
MSAVEQFCEKLTGRIAGKSVKKKTEPVKTYGNRVVYKSSYSDYTAGSDPTLWLSVVGFAGSAIGFAASGISYEAKKFMSFGSNANFILMAGSFFGSTDPMLALLAYKEKQSERNDQKKAEKKRDTGYIVSGGIGGFGVIMLITFLGRYAANYAVNDYNSGNIAVILPPQYNNPMDWVNRKKFNFGMGVSMRF